MTDSSMSPEIRDKVYRPGVDGAIEDVELQFDRPQTSSGWEAMSDAGTSETDDDEQAEG